MSPANLHALLFFAALAFVSAMVACAAAGGAR